MEPLEVMINGTKFTALPMPDGSFQIFEKDNHLGNITPILTTPMYIKWFTADLFSDELAQLIGEAIETKEM